MRTVLARFLEIYILFLLLPLVKLQKLASSVFASEQVVLWSGNNATQYVQPASAYQFSYTFVDPPANLSQAYAIFNGFNFINQNRISFSVNVILMPSTGTFTIYFIPLSTLAFYSVSVSIIAAPLSAFSLISIGRYYLNPSLINQTTRNGTNQESFTLTAMIIMSHNNFQLRNFLSAFDAYHANGIAGLNMDRMSTYAVGSNQFILNLYVESGAELYLCSMISIIIDRNAIQVGHSFYSVGGFQVSNNFMALSNLSITSYTSSNFTISSVYGPVLSRNCTIGFHGLEVNTDNSNKALLFTYNTNSGTMANIEIGGGGVLAFYHALCIIDCDPQGFYNTALSKCQYCKDYIPKCLACVNNTVCTDCGYNSFFDTLNLVCRCKSGNRVTGGCTSIMACEIIDSNGLCTQCQTGFTLSSNYLCVCSPGYQLVTNICIKIPGCITAAFVLGTPKCFGCNATLHFQPDGNGSCKCIHGYSMLNGLCTTLCGNGQMFGIEQCDDGNHVSGDGCFSFCQVQTSYQCRTTLLANSVCSYKAQFAQITLIQSYRDKQENAGYFIFTVVPTISNLNKMNFQSAVSLSCNASISSPTVQYADGILKIKVVFQENIQKREMNITLKFNETIIIHKPISNVFNIQSMNSPMVIFTKFPEYDFLALYMKIMSMVAVVVFIFGSWAHKMIGVQTIHIFQFIYFTCIYQVTYSDLFVSSLQSLRFSSNYPDPFYNEMTNIKQGDIFQSLMFAFTFVGNYYIIGTVQIIIIFALIVVYLTKVFTNQNKQQQTDIQIDWKITLQCKFQRRTEYVYLIAFFPLVVGYYLQCFFAVQAQSYRKNKIISKLQLLTNSFLIIIFIFIASTIMFREIFSNIKRSIRSKYYNVQGRYITMYITNILLNLIFFNFSDRFQYDLTSFACYNFLYFLSILAYRPYKHHLHNFHILFNQTIYIMWIVFLIYQDRTDSPLSDNTKYIILTILISMLSLSLIIAAVRILLEVVENGTQKQKIYNFFEDQLTRKKNARLKSERRMKKIMDEDVGAIRKYRLKDQHQRIIESNRQQINAQRNELGLNNVFQPPNAIRMPQQTQIKREDTFMQKEDLDNDDSFSAKKNAEIQELKNKLRQNLQQYRRRQMEEKLLQ